MDALLNEYSYIIYAYLVKLCMHVPCKGSPEEVIHKLYRSSFFLSVLFSLLTSIKEALM